LGRSIARRVDRDAGPGVGVEDMAVGIGISGKADIDHNSLTLGQRLEQPATGGRQILHELDDHRPHRRPKPQGRGGGVDEVVLVVPGRRQVGPDPTGDPQNIGGAGTASGYGLDSSSAQAGQFSYGRNERQLGRRMVGDRRQ
jgi:hypothetical protein